MTPQYITADEAARLRQARNTVRHYEKRLQAGEKLAIHRARYEKALAALVAHKLSGKLIRHDAKSQPQPVIDCEHDNLL